MFMFCYYVNKFELYFKSNLMQIKWLQKGMSTKESGLLLGLDDSYCSRQARMEITFKGQEQGNVRGQGTEMGTWMGNREREQRRGMGTCYNKEGNDSSFDR